MTGSQTTWGHLTLLGIESRKIMQRDLNGIEYATGEIGPRVMRLRCRCGHEFEIESRLFPGRREMRDCGRDECEYANGLKRDQDREKEAQEVRTLLMDQRRDTQRKQAETRLEDLRQQMTRRLPGRPLSNRPPGRNVTAYITSDEHEAILAYAAEHSVTVSRAVGALVQVGSQYLRVQKELQSQAEIEAPESPEPINRPRGRKLRFPVESSGNLTE